jgi:hypothetical protein
MKIPDSLRQRILEASKYRCGYCMMPVDLIYGFIEIDHIDPRARGGKDNEVNLWLACSRCNNFKSDQTHGIDLQTGESVPLFNPRHQNWHEHFSWQPDDRAIITGTTPCGRVTIAALKMNLDDSVSFRRLMVFLGLYPPD